MLVESASPPFQSGSIRLNNEIIFQIIFLDHTSSVVAKLKREMLGYC